MSPGFSCNVRGKMQMIGSETAASFSDRDDVDVCRIGLTK